MIWLIYALLSLCIGLMFACMRLFDKLTRGIDAETKGTEMILLLLIFLVTIAGLFVFMERVS